MRLSLLPVVTSAAALFLSNCSPRYTASLAPDAAQKANEDLDRMEKAPRKPASPDTRLRTRLLFADSAAYAALRKQESGVKRLPRVRSLVSPVPEKPNLRAMVKVSFIVDEKGRVEDARIFESSDSRLDKASVDAVKQWVYYPGTISGKPAKFLFTVPFVFAGVRGDSSRLPRVRC